MVVPTSVNAQFRRLDKNLAELGRLKGSALDEDKSVLVAEMCNSCILTLDKAMNALWEVKGAKKEGKGKPHIYFPINLSNKDKLTDKLRQYQMPDLEEAEPKIFEIIDSVQVYKGVTWLRAIYDIAVIRHESFPKINQVNEKGIGFGRGQDLYIESMTSDGFGNIKFKGHGINRKSGKVEPVRVDFINEVRSVLEGVAEEPYQFCSSSVAKVKHVVRELYKHLHRR